MLRAGINVCLVPKADACTAKNSWLEAALVQAGAPLINHIAPGRRTLAPFAYGAIARLKQIGFEVGESFDLDKADPAIKAGLDSAPDAAQKLMQWKMPTMARVANGWSMNTDTMGVYGNYYLKRAIVAQQGLGANLPEDAIYPLNLADDTGKPLDGASNYMIHFDKGQTPPAEAFWSITLYDNDGFQVANPLNRFALSSWMPFELNPDGSLDLYFQNASPGADKDANWLPAPKGPFNLTMRIYAPKAMEPTTRREGADSSCSSSITHRPTHPRFIVHSA